MTLKEKIMYKEKPKEAPSTIKYRESMPLTLSLRTWLDGEMSKRKVNERKIRNG